MKKILIFLLLIGSLNAQTLFDGKAGDVWHITGSTLGTLAIQKTFQTEWETSAGSMFIVGLTWELMDEYYKKSPFDPAGFSDVDLFFDIVGIMLSYPLRYNFSLTHNMISVRFYL